MKSILIAFVFFFFQFVANAQVWCPSGAVWHYGRNSFSAAEYYKLEYDSDTLINSITCKKIKKTVYSYYHSGANFDTVNLANEYTYSDSNKVYIYRFNNFYTLYDFSANVGDVWEVAGINQYSWALCDSVGFVKVDSVGTMLINGYNLRYVCVSPTINSKWGWSGRIVEKIGPIINYPIGLETYSYLFPNKLDYCGMYLDQSPEGGFLRCYYDSTFGFYSTGIVSDCEYLATDIKENDAEVGLFLIAPNPFYNNCTISYSIKNKYQKAEIVIYNSLGNSVQIIPLLKNDNNVSLNRSDFKSGIYTCVLMVDGSFLAYEKVVVF